MVRCSAVWYKVGHIFEGDYFRVPWFCGPCFQYKVHGQNSHWLQRVVCAAVEKENKKLLKYLFFFTQVYFQTCTSLLLPKQMSWISTYQGTRVFVELGNCTYLSMEFEYFYHLCPEVSNHGTLLLLMLVLVLVFSLLHLNPAGRCSTSFWFRR